MTRQQTDGLAWTGPREIASVIDYEFYRERARRLREQAVAGGVRDFVYRTITRFCGTPGSRLPVRPQYS
jgi:hypothetical protein